MGALAFATEMLEVVLAEPSLDEGPRVHAGRRMPLEIDEISRMVTRPGVEEMIEPDLVKGRRRGEGRNVAADAGKLGVGPRHHRHGVPADDAFDPPLDLEISWIAWLLVSRNRVDVRRVGREGEGHTPKVGAFLQVDQKLLQPLGAVSDQNVIKGLKPFLQLVGCDPRNVIGDQAFPHRA